MILQTNLRSISTGSSLFSEDNNEPKKDEVPSNKVPIYPVETSIKYIKSKGNNIFNIQYLISLLIMWPTFLQWKGGHNLIEKKNIVKKRNILFIATIILYNMINE